MNCAIATALEAVSVEECRAFLIRRLHPGGYCCPDCRVSLDGRQAMSFASGGRVRCNGCGRWYSWRTGTVVSRSSLDERQLFLLLLLSALHCSLADIAAACRLSHDETYVWLRRLSGTPS